MMLNSNYVKSKEYKTKILFIHHSTGANLIQEGEVRKLLKEKNSLIEFWDHNYNLNKLFPKLFSIFTNQKGLSDQNGNYIGKDFNIEISNNSPKEYVEIFSRNEDNSSLKSILQFDIIVFKNCFPTSKITSNKQFEEYKKYYESIRENLEKYPNKKFILLTSPPLRKELTSIEESKRAKEISKWLVSENFLQNSTNLVVFDFFNLLADEGGMLKKEYTKFIPFDGHPNKKANIEIAPKFVDFILEVEKK